MSTIRTSYSDFSVYESILQHKAEFAEFTDKQKINATKEINEKREKKREKQHKDCTL